MAKPATTVPADDIKLSVHEPESKPGKYDAHIRAMIDADAKLEKDEPERYAKGARTAVTVTFPGPNRETKKRANGDEYEAIVGEEAKYKRFFQDSAKTHERTAKVVKTTPQGDGLITYEFVLGDKVSRGRGKGTDEKGSEEASTDAETTEDTPKETVPASAA